MNIDVVAQIAWAIIILVSIILFAGTPDIHDVIIQRLSK